MFLVYLQYFKKEEGTFYLSYLMLVGNTSTAIAARMEAAQPEQSAMMSRTVAAAP